VQSRVFEVAYDDKGRNVGYYIRISNGPGIKTQTGAVMPDKARAAEIAKVQVFIPKDNIRQIAAAVENRIRAYEMLIVANRARAQAKKGE
jgi:hypothetical protein